MGNSLYVGVSSTDFKTIRLRSGDDFDVTMQGYEDIPGAPSVTIGSFAKTDASSDAIGGLANFTVDSLHSYFTGDLQVTDSFKCSSGFGCNGADPQLKYTVNAALSTAVAGSTTFLIAKANSSDLNKTRESLNQIRAALVANGILV